MTNEYSIGVFAQVAGVSTKTLRFYDQVGLLRPTRVDPRTRYRFYLPQQLEELAAIVELRDAGASLADIRRLKGRPGFENSWRQVLHDLKRATERSIEQANRSLKWINCLLDQEEDSRRPIPVVIKRRPSVAIASIRSKVHACEMRFPAPPWASCKESCGTAAPTRVASRANHSSPSDNECHRGALTTCANYPPRSSRAPIRPWTTTARTRPTRLFPDGHRSKATGR